MFLAHGQTQINTDSFFEHEFTVRMVGFEHESHEFHEYFFAHRQTADFTMRMNQPNGPDGDIRAIREIRVQK